MNLVKHVAIIMDGNGRWGIKNKGSRNSGHRAGLNTVESIIEESIKQKISHLTLYTFSTENWKRPKKEIFFLFSLLENFLSKKINNLMENEIKLNIVGNRSKFSNKLQKLLRISEKKTSKNTRLQINLALNYGSKTEIKDALIKSAKSGKKITEDLINKNLYTGNLPNPDILVRTGGKKRLSNFMLWQLAYAELYFVDKLWPDFSEQDLKKIINNFKKIKRNYGKI